MEVLQSPCDHEGQAKRTERSTEIGKLLSSYLEKKREVEDHSVHLLFSANRWEHVPLIKEKLSQGVTLVVDRYAFSGVAFTSAKENFSLDWCKQPDVGLPKPDLVVFLQLQLAEAAVRGEFGRERYESSPFQQRALQRFQQLLGDSSLPWKVGAVPGPSWGQRFWSWGWCRTWVGALMLAQGPGSRAAIPCGGPCTELAVQRAPVPCRTSAARGQHLERRVRRCQAAAL
ncbi:thymidylate kinase isoform X2 [Physeter macrocephalus]|uniref:dTMP kinase n=1 Tax=Physeter macrocephalus TaxID=9755 RepID=A0A455AU50_PHYMC|nr:thymidylate kinase isoform X2 [Physeter catodon]|eukprot:XP_028339418.1 thymidylate kinase isoform X2 [Physeter catodon]